MLPGFDWEIEAELLAPLFTDDWIWLIPLPPDVPML